MYRMTRKWEFIGLWVICRAVLQVFHFAHLCPDFQTCWGTFSCHCLGLSLAPSFCIAQKTSTLFSFLWKIRKFSQSGSLVPSSQSGQLPTSSFPHSHHFLSTSNTFYNLKYKQIHFWFRKIHHLNLDSCQQVHFHTRTPFNWNLQ